MIDGALEPYERTLRRPRPLTLVATDGRHVRLDVARYVAGCDRVDESVLARTHGPVIDIGCGPGRFVAALAARGVTALGIDLAPTAVALARNRGAVALRRNVFARLPGEGRWNTALLIDGNVGIGGDVDRLLRRVDQLLAPAGRVIVETARDPRANERLTVRFASSNETVGPAFPWALVGARTLAERAVRVGFFLLDTWTEGGRSFAVLDRALPTP